MTASIVVVVVVVEVVEVIVVVKVVLPVVVVVVEFDFAVVDNELVIVVDKLAFEKLETIGHARYL